MRGVFWGVIISSIVAILTVTGGMNVETLALGTRLIWGADALEALGELEGQRVLMVSDGFWMKNGKAEEIARRTKASQTEIFGEVAGEPDLKLVAKGVVALEKVDAQVVVALGGGSAMDCAKALGWCAGRKVRLWCIPTTAGTGSEVTAFSVLTDSEKGVKYPLVDPSLVPETAILDSGFLAGVPGEITAYTALDVLTHALEGYVAKGANPFTDAMAEYAAANAYRHITAAVAGDMAARGELLMCSTLAGMAFNRAGLGVCHALAHALGARLHAPHGKVNGLLLPKVIEANARDAATAKKYARMAALLGLSPNARALSGAMKRLGQRLGLPEKLSGTVDPKAVAADARADFCMDGNVKTFTDNELEKIIREVVG